MQKPRREGSPAANDRMERSRLAALDGQKARAEYEGASATIEERTARLKALRLERERAEPAPAPAAKASPRRAAKVTRRNVPM